MKHLNKFNEHKDDISDKGTSMEFKKDKPSEVSNDVEDLDNQLKKTIDSTLLEGEWEIEEIIDVSTNEPSDEVKKESLIINAEVGDKTIKRGEFIYITAMINKKGGSYHQSKMGVIKVRVVEIYNTLLVLNNLR